MTPESNFNLGVLAVGTLGIEKASLPAVLRAAQTCRYLVYSEADFEVFRPTGATRCTDGVKFLAWRRGPSMPNFTPIGATTRV